MGEERAANVHAASHYSTNTLCLNRSTGLKRLPCISSLVGKPFLFLHPNCGDSLSEIGSGSKITMRFICEENRKTYFENLLVPWLFPKSSVLARSFSTGGCLLSAKRVHQVSQSPENKFAKDKWRLVMIL